MTLNTRDYLYFLSVGAINLYRVYFAYLWQYAAHAVNWLYNNRGRFNEQFSALSLWFNPAATSSAIPLIVPQPESQKTKDERYETNRKRQFVASFGSENQEQWSANIDAILYDKKQTMEALLDENNQLETRWNRNVLMENTPRGNIIMYYNVYKRAFSYFSDTAGIPYSILNAAAMKYVLMFKCRDLFVDNMFADIAGVSPSKYAEVWNNEKEASDKHEKVKKMVASSDAPFAKFKSYNNAAAKAEAKVDATADPKADPAKQPVSKQINTFSYMGKTCNFSFLNKPKVANANNGFSTGLLPSAKLSYEEYKAKMQKAKEYIAQS
jgi:hypothetical protein